MSSPKERIKPKLTFATFDLAQEDVKKNRNLKDGTFGIRRESNSFIYKSYTPGPGFYS